MSLRLRVWLGIATIALLVVASAFATHRLVERSLIDQVDARLRSVPIDRGFGRIPNPGPPLRPDFTGPRFNAFFVGEYSGGTMTTVFNAGADQHTLPPPAVTGHTINDSLQQQPPQIFTARAKGSSLEYRVAIARDQRDATLIHVIAAPLNDVQDSLSNLTRITLVITLTILLALAIIAWWMIRLGVRPVKQIALTASNIANPDTPFDLSERVTTLAEGTEVGDLGRAFNTMLDHLEGSFAEQRRIEARLRQFVSDASHELRTPVQTIRGYAELYRLGALTRGDQLDDAMRRTEQESVRMAALVDDLLTLARYDNERPIAHEPIDLSILARDAASDARAVQPTRVVSIDALAPVVVEGDDHQLRQVFANVISNALIHTPVSASISIRVFTDGSEAVVEVCDNGPGMTPDVAERAFERFVRADDSRSRRVGGSGLGLAIVEAAVGAHGGSVNLVSLVDGETVTGNNAGAQHGTTVIIRLPKMLGSIAQR